MENRILSQFKMSFNYSRSLLHFQLIPLYVMLFFSLYIPFQKQFKKINFVTKSRSSKIFYQQNTRKQCKKKSISGKLILFVDQKSCCFSIKYVNRMKHLHYS